MCWRWQMQNEFVFVPFVTVLLLHFFQWELQWYWYTHTDHDFIQFSHVYRKDNCDLFHFPLGLASQPPERLFFPGRRWNNRVSTVSTAHFPDHHRLPDHPTPEPQPNPGSVESPHLTTTQLGIYYCTQLEQGFCHGGVIYNIIYGEADVNFYNTLLL